MREFARHAFTAIAALSLLLCLTVAGLWMSSYSTWTELRCFAGEQYIHFESERGQIEFFWGHWIRRAMPTVAVSGYPLGGIPAQQHTGFAAYRRPYSYKKGPIYSTTAYTFPHWFAIAMLSILPGFWLRRRRHRSPIPTRGFEVHPDPEQHAQASGSA